MSPSVISAPAIAAVIVGGVLLLVATVMALRPKAVTSSVGWLIIATFAYCIFGLAAAMQLRESDGLRAAAMQFLALALAVVLLLQYQSGPASEEAPRQGLASTARAVVWLTLLGIPPTVGFHAKVMLYRSLLSVGWGGMAALAMAAAAAGVLPALSAIGSRPPLPLRGARAVFAVVVIALIVILGIYPQPAISLAGLVQNLVKSG
jgi:NADH:ubiquinone oxidoreductase subunit 2 (subunit N)